VLYTTILISTVSVLIYLERVKIVAVYEATTTIMARIIVIFSFFFYIISVYINLINLYIVEFIHSPQLKY